MILQGLTWTQFVYAVCILGIIYYVYLFVRFAKKGEQLNVTDEPQNEEFEEDLQDQAAITDELFEKADELISALLSKIGSITDRELLKEQLSATLKLYPELNIPAFRAGINNRIFSEMNDKGSAMSEREIEQLW